MQYYQDGKEKSRTFLFVQIALAITSLNSKENEDIDELSKNVAKKTMEMIDALDRDGRLTVVSINSGVHYNFSCK